MGSRELKNYCALTEQIMELLKFAMSDLNLSARAYDRILKVARTIGRFKPALKHRWGPRLRSDSISFTGPPVVDLRVKSENAKQRRNFVVIPATANFFWLPKAQLTFNQAALA